MSSYYREHGKIYEPEYERPGRTKQSFAKSADINWILQRAQKVGSLSHFEKHGASYGDFSSAPADLLEAHGLLKRGEAVFQELPSELRKEFNNSMFEFFAYVNDPANKDDLKKKLPKLAEPGRQFPSDPTPPQAAAAVSDAGSSDSPSGGDTGATSA
jgi:hypothetical protein